MRLLNEPRAAGKPSASKLLLFYKRSSMKVCKQQGGTHVGVLRTYEKETTYSKHMHAFFFFIGRKRRHYTGYLRSCSQIDFEFIDTEIRLVSPAKRCTEQNTWHNVSCTSVSLTSDIFINKAPRPVKCGAPTEN
jgi:hypothetical protein